LFCAFINHDARPAIVEALLTLIIKMEQGACCFRFYLSRQSILLLWLSVTCCHSDYPGRSTISRWRSFSGSGRQCISYCFHSTRCQWVQKWHICTNIYLLRLTVGYLNATINRTPEMQKRILEPTGLCKPGKDPRLTGIGQDLAHQEAAGQVFGRYWNRTKPFFRSKPGPLAGYPDPLLTLDGAGAIEVDLRLGLRLFHFSFGHADFLVSLWMAILRL
jgi:hypothetical protein